MSDFDTQVAVIGAGPGGYGAAFMAADLGLQVTLIDPEANPGGVCLYRGCIPSKSLLHVASQIMDARESPAHGVSFGKPRIDTARLNQWKNDVVARLTGGLGRLARQRKVTYIQGTARFNDPHSLQITEGSGNTRPLTFESAIIASGSKANPLPEMELEDHRVLGATEALALKQVPPKLLVVGGGYIGLELGTVYAALGSRVTLVEITAGLLPGVDRDLVRVLAKQIQDTFEGLHLETRLESLKRQKNGLRAVLQGTNAPAQTRIFDQVLAAVGRRPRTANLGLEHTAVEIDQRGFIRTDRQKRTAEPSIFAVGDVAGEPMLAHKATHEGRVAAEVIAGRRAAFEPLAIPAVVFTEPEIAWAGLTETEAKQRGIHCTVSRFPWGASGRAATLGRSEGLTKLLVAPESEALLGIGIVGRGAGELIAEGVLALEMGANVTDLGLSIHPHPTLSETLMEAAQGLEGTATSFYRPARKK